MTLNEYQQKAATTSKGTLIGGSPLPYIGLGLAGEAGEVADRIKKVWRDNDGTATPADKIALLLEGGDCLWYLAALCTALGITLEEMAQENIKKLASRQARNVISGNGDYR